MAEAKQIKIIRKKWLPIKASKFFDSELLGESYVVGADQLMGRTVAANLANLTGDIRQQSVTLSFIVTSLDGEAGVADVIGYSMASSAIRRIVRRGSDRLDESLVCDTSDAKKVRIKPMIITKSVTNSGVHHLLRKMLVSSIVKMVKQHTFESLINEIITAKLQVALKGELKKVYPLKAVEISALKLLHEGKEGGEEPEAAEAGQGHVRELKNGLEEESQGKQEKPKAEPLEASQGAEAASEGA